MQFEFRADREAHLRELCAEMGRSVDDFINEAVLTFMEDYEDGRDADEAMKEFLAGEGKTFGLQELVREYGMEPGDLAEGAQAVGSVGPADKDSHSQISRDQTPHAA